jgi:hypothetical protein
MSYTRAYEDGTECSETLAIKLHTPQNNPKEKITAFKTRRKSEINNFKFIVHITVVNSAP